MRPISQLKLAGRLLGCILLALQLSTFLPSHSYAQDFPPPVLEMVRLINQARAQRGLPLYLLNPVLTQAAQAHVDDLLANRRLGHVGSDGSRVAGRLQRVGYAAAQVSENWVYSRDLARGFRWWMADPPHRANILHRNFTEIGVGMAPHPNGWGQVWVVDFAAGANGPAAESLLIGEPPTEATIAAAEPAPIDGNIYVIQAGDTLDALGRRLGIPWQRIAEYNGITDPTLLQVGQVVEIPGRAAEAPVVTTEAAPPAEPAAPPPPPPAEAAAPAPVDAAAPAPSEPAPAPAAPAPAVKPTIHTVRAGESLATIAPRYGLSWQTLAAMNGLDSRSVLQVGQVLRLHGTAPAAPAAPASAGTATTHTVRAGESLATIAPRYGFTWQELAALNGLDGQTILQVGQVLRLTRASPAAPASSGKPATVTVRKGDSLYSLATRFRIDWQDLARVNGLTGKSTLQVGQVLRLP